MSLEKVYRANLHAEELIDCGFNPESEDGGWSTIQGILLAKGLPGWCLDDQTPVRISPNGTGLTLEFGS